MFHLFVHIIFVGLENTKNIQERRRSGKHEAHKTTGGHGKEILLGKTTGTLAVYDERGKATILPNSLSVY